MDAGLFIIRIVLGLSLAAHGAQKLFGLFGGPGLDDAGDFFESLGLHPGRPFATAAGLAELAGGLALAIGLLTPFAAAAVIATMIVAAWTVHVDNGFFVSDGGYEHTLLVAATAAGVAFVGPGSASVDAAAGLTLYGTDWGLVAVGLGVLGAIPPLVLRSVSSGATGSPTEE